MRHCQLILLFRLLLVLLAFSMQFVCLQANAQNLVPNPGFEENEGNQVLNWKQPKGQWYHYEKRFMGAKGYQCINGICILSNAPSEYLHVKLKEPLQPGQKYFLSLKLLPMSRLNSIQVYFSDDNFNVSRRRKIYAAPQLTIPLEDAKTWVEYGTVFTAKGAEKYLTIGHFFEKKFNKIDEAMAKDQKKIDDFSQARITIIEKNIEKSYPPLPKNFSYQNIDAQDENIKQQVTKMRVQLKDSLEWLANEIDRKNDSLITYYQSLDLHGQVRLYLDDICLVPEPEKSACVCVPDAMKTENQEKVFVKGSSFKLNEITFETNKSALLEKSFTELNLLLELLNQNPRMRIRINGHTDNVGKEEYNQKLSLERAQAVVDYLISKKISAVRLEFAGFGSTKPLSSNKTAEGRENNRRVEFEVIEE